MRCAHTQVDSPGARTHPAPTSVTVAIYCGPWDVLTLHSQHCRCIRILADQQTPHRPSTDIVGTCIGTARLDTTCLDTARLGASRSSTNVSCERPGFLSSIDRSVLHRGRSGQDVEPHVACWDILAAHAAVIVRAGSTIAGHERAARQGLSRYRARPACHRRASRRTWRWRRRRYRHVWPVEA